MRRCLILLALLASVGCGYMLGVGRVQEGAVLPVMAEDTGDPFEEYRAVREAAYASGAEQLRCIIHAPDGEDEITALARSQLAEAAGRRCTETAIEGRLAMQGFDAVASVSAGQAAVYVRAEMLTGMQIAVISEIICAETGFSNDNVKIIPMNYGNF